MPGPIALDDPSSAPRWSRKLLGFLWLCQLCIIGIFLFMTFLVLILVFGADAHKQLSVAFMASSVIIFLSNVATLCCILYEFTYLASITQLTTHRYYRIQLVKSLYFIALIVLVVASGSGTPMSTGQTRGKVWSDVWRLCIIVTPFWAALAYAVVMRKKNASPFGDESVRLLTLLW